MVTLQAPDGQEADISPGGLIGRLASAALCIDDPRISEAHAMVSLRGGRLLLLALRGGLRVGSRRVSRVELAAGQRVELVDGLPVTVLRLQLPAEVLAVQIDGGGAEPLVTSVYSILPGGQLVAGIDEGALGHIWSAAEGWRIRATGQPAAALSLGSHTRLGGHRISAVGLPASAASVEPTIASAADRPPLHLTARHETAHLHRSDGVMVHIPGIAARIISELIDYETPVPWELVARVVWPGQADRFTLRQNWDRNLRALRRRLREAGVRDDIVRPDGRGNIELFLMPGDAVVDER